MNILSKDPAFNVDLIVSGDEYDYISKYIDLTVEPINLPSIILKPHYKSIIPLKLYQTWEVKDNLPLKMKNNVDQLKRDNPEFEYFLYDDTMCRDFIKDNFPKDVLYAYDKLIPGAYRADLWRYCILYKNGGVYLDIKYRCMNGFKLIALTEKEYFVRDFENFEEIGIYNALMVCKPDNSILLKCINKIVENCQTEYYGPNYLYPTGPHLLNKYLSKSYIDELEMELHYDENNRVHHIDNKQINYFSIKYRISMDNIHVKYCKVHILEAYPEYVLDKMNHSKNPYYMDCWENKNIYDKNPEKSVAADTPFIPLDIYQTWYTLNLPPKMRETVEILKKQNPEFKHYLYDDAMCRNFIERHFSSDVLFAFDMLKPGAYKSDLWRYCILYKKGGIYLDIKFYCANNFKLINLTDKEYYARDRIQYGRHGIYQAFLACKPNNLILLQCINTIVKNCKNYYYHFSPLAITGPQMMNIFFTDEEIVKFDLELESNGYCISYKGKQAIINYSEYRNETHVKHYSAYYFNHEVFMYKWLYDHSIKRITNNDIQIMKPHKGVFNFFQLPYINIKFDENNFCTVETIYIDNEYQKKILPMKKLYYMNYTLTFDPLFELINLNKDIISDITHYKKKFSQMDIDRLRLLFHNSKYYMNGNFFDNRIKKQYYIIGEHNITENENIIKLSVDGSGLIDVNDDIYCNDKIKLCYFDVDDYIFELSEELSEEISEEINEKYIGLIECRTAPDVLKNVYDNTFGYRYENEKYISLFEYKNDLAVITDWYPLKICKLNYETKKIELFETRNVPEFLKNIYDSTSGYRYGNEIWFICNKIQIIYNICHSFYILVVFDINMNFLRHSEMFKFGKPPESHTREDDIMYCTEMQIHNQFVLITYVNKDRNTVIEVFNKSFIFKELRYFYS